MKISLSLILLVVASSVTLTGNAAAAIIIDGTPPTTEFEVKNDSQTIELSNVHRTGGKLRFRLQGAQLTKVHRKYEPVWNANLTDGHELSISYHSEANTNSTKWTFIWKGATEQNITKDLTAQHGVCFDFGFNNAIW